MTSAPDLDRTDLAATLQRAGIPDAAALAALATPGVRIVATRATAARLPMGASRFGGSPDVPAGFVWPTREGAPLTFLAQLELAAIRAPGLPAAGWLLFFYDAVEQPWGFDPDDEGSACVVHIDSGPETLTRCPHPEIDSAGGPFDLCTLTFDPTVELPDPMDCVLVDAGLEVAPEHCDAYQAIADVVEGSPHHHLLGHPQLVQGDMRGECQLVTNGFAWAGADLDEDDEDDDEREVADDDLDDEDEAGDGGANDDDDDGDGDDGIVVDEADLPRAEALLREAGATWQLLLQIDSDADGPGWVWADGGRIYFWIRHADLAARAFDKSWLVLQCY